MSEQSRRMLGSRYELLSEIGRGATSNVWRGRVKESGEPVAIKILRPDAASDPEFLARFTAERAVLKAVQHPNLVAVRDLVADAGSVALVFEYVDGTTLRERLGKEGLSVSDAMSIGRALAGALAALHATDIVHCDVKPGNILLTQDGQIRLADLGIAWLLHAERSGSEATSPLGTAGYLAPEVTLGAAPTPAADVYALGVVIYEMLTGRPVSEVATRARSGTRLPMPRDGDVGELNESAQPTRSLARIPDVPRDLWRLVGRCLRADPAGRPSAAALASLLTGGIGITSGVGPADRAGVPTAQLTGEADVAEEDLPTVHSREPVGSSGVVQHGRDAPPPTRRGVVATGRNTARHGTAARWVATTALATAIIGCLVVIGLLPATFGSTATPLLPTTQPSTSKPTPATTSQARASGISDRAPATRESRGDRGANALESYEAPTGWLCRPPATASYEGITLAIQPCLTVRNISTRAMLRHTWTGSAPSRVLVEATLQLLTFGPQPHVVDTVTCDLPTQSGTCPEAAVRATPGSAYYAVVRLEIQGSSAKPVTLSTPIIHNNEPQDHNSEDPATNQRFR